MNNRSHRTSLADEVEAVARQIARYCGRAHKREIKASLVAMGLSAWTWDFRLDHVIEAVREEPANGEMTDA